jgi:glutamate formiminotransferase
MIGEEGVPVYLYGVLGDGRTRAELRRPGALDGLEPDFGPAARHPTAGATLVAARPPLVALNVEIDATIRSARDIASRVRRLPGVVALGLELAGQGIVQVSTNIEDHTQTTPAQVVELVRAHAPVRRAELVALTPAAAFADFPADVQVTGLRTIEDALAGHSSRH